MTVELKQWRSHAIAVQLWIFASAIAFAVLHLYLSGNRADGDPHLAFHGLLWGIAVWLLWRKRDRLSSTSNPISSFLGFALVLLALTKSLSLYWFETRALNVLPIVALCGLGLLAVGIRRFWQGWIDIVLVGCMFVPTGPILETVASPLPITDLTAQCAAFLLHYLGFDVVARGSLISLPTGGVRVLMYCTGLSIALTLVQLALLLGLVFRASWQRVLWAAAGAVGCGFLVGSMRAALLAVVVDRPEVFHFWHDSSGGQIFSTVAIVGFGSFCLQYLDAKETAAASQTPKQPADRRTIGNRGRRQFWHLRYAVATWGAVMLSLAIAIGVPTAGQLQVEPLKFPASGVPLPDWEVVSTERLVSPTQKLSKGIEVVQAGQRYRYRSSDGQQLQVDIRYQLGEKSGSGNVGVRQADINPKAPPAQTIVGQTETGFYRLTTNERAIGLDACINPRGGSTVTAVQFVANRYQYDFKPHRLWNWFLGRDILKDDRCLWTSMSVPIDGIAPEAAKKDLVAAWLAWADWWQPRFPKP